MSRRVDTGLSELVYSLICKNPGIFKYDLYHKVSEIPGFTITHAELDDVIFFTSVCIMVYLLCVVTVILRMKINFIVVVVIIFPGK